MSSAYPPPPAPRSACDSCLSNYFALCFFILIGFLIALMVVEFFGLESIPGMFVQGRLRRALQWGGGESGALVEE